MDSYRSRYVFLQVSFLKRYFLEMYRLRNDTLIPVVAYLRTGAMRTTSDVRYRLPYSVVIDIIRLVILVCTPNRPFPRALWEM